MLLWFSCSSHIVRSPMSSFMVMKCMFPLHVIHQIADTTLIPSNAEYRVALAEGSLSVRVTTHSFDRVIATFEIRDKNNGVSSEWNATLRNQDHQEIETSDGPNGTAYSVMLFGCTKPYPIELRVPDEDGQWLYWLRISIIHPMIPRSGLKKASLILLRQ